MPPSDQRQVFSINARVKEFAIPPIHDAMVLGKRSPIGSAALRKAISLLVSSPFEHIEVDDPVIGDILVRTSILRRIPRERLIVFVIDQLKPLMEADEILHVNLEIEVCVEASRV